MDYHAVAADLEKALGINNLLLFYLIWRHRVLDKTSKQLNAAFTKIRALEGKQPVKKE